MSEDGRLHWAVISGGLIDRSSHLSRQPVLLMERVTQRGYLDQTMPYQLVPLSVNMEKDYKEGLTEQKSSLLSSSSCSYTFSKTRSKLKDCGPFVTENLGSLW